MGLTGNSHLFARHIAEFPLPNRPAADFVHTTRVRDVLSSDIFERSFASLGEQFGNDDRAQRRHHSERPQGACHA